MESGSGGPGGRLPRWWWLGVGPCPVRGQTERRPSAAARSPCPHRTAPYRTTLTNVEQRQSRAEPCPAVQYIYIQIAEQSLATRAGAQSTNVSHMLRSTQGRRAYGKFTTKDGLY